MTTFADRSIPATALDAARDAQAEVHSRDDRSAFDFAQDTYQSSKEPRPINGDAPMGHHAVVPIGHAQHFGGERPGMISEETSECGAVGIAARWPVGHDALSDAPRDTTGGLGCHHETERPLPPITFDHSVQVRSTTRMNAVQEAVRRTALVQQARSLLAAGLPWPRIGRQLGVPYATLWRWYNATRDQAVPSPETLAPQTHKSGRKPKTPLSAEDQAKLRSIYLKTNRNKGSGSSQEAARIALRGGLLSPDLAAEVARRQEAGIDLLPDRIRQAITLSKSQVLAHRNEGEARLAYGNTSGTMRWVHDRVTGEQRIARAGDVWESDDGSINLITCIPWDVGGCKTSERYGVKVGRFQWLPALDAGTSYILGYTYTARPKNSYRAEDILALLRSMFRAHGIPQRLRFERGTWEAKAIDQVMTTLGIDRWTAWSPRQKLIENLFGTLWTKLSILPGQIGRFQGEQEAENDLLVKARAGTIDPRKHFPMLSQVLQAMDVVIAEKNRTPVESEIYGTWVPAERWALQKSEGRLTKWNADTAWLFSPCRRELTVTGGHIKTSVAVTDDWSVRYTYTSPDLHRYEGKKVALYFDPFADRCEGTAVLLDNSPTASSGDVIGTVFQIDQVARHARRMLGWGDDADLGKAIAKDTRHDMVRASRAALPDGSVGIDTQEIRLVSGGSALLPGSSGVSPETGRSAGPALTTATPEAYATARKRRAASLSALATLTDQE